MTTTKKTVTVVHCWSAPRSRSTALLYSFEARGSDNTVAVDEPLYREWLIRRHKEAGVSRPYQDAFLSGTPPPDRPADEAAVWQRELQSLKERIHQGAKRLTAPDGDGLIFCKHMAKHFICYDFEKELVADDNENFQLVHKHILLIRDPVAVLSSWGAAASNHGNVATPDEVGIVPLLSIYSTLQSRRSSALDSANCVHVLNSDDLVQDPPAILAALCNDFLGVSYSDSMLTWSAGPHACDGPWASWWYADVHQSSGWKLRDDNDTTNTMAPTQSRYRTLDPRLHAALQTSFPAYQCLLQHTSGYHQRGPPASEIYEDPRNAHLLVWIGAPGRGRLCPRHLAGVNPWDASVQGGDAAWEGLRVYRGKILSLDAHLHRLYASAKALGFQNVHTRDEVVEAIFQTLAANGMRDGAHMRLTLTRGEKCTSSMNPQFNVYGTTLIILPEWKPTEGATTYDNTAGISLLSASQRRNSPQCVDSKIHHNNMINNILPKIQANLAQCHDALMLDLDGFVSETNATNVFMVNETGTLITPPPDSCLPGITRAAVLVLARELEIAVEVRRVSLAEFHAAEEVFTTGTMGGLTPVTQIDGRVIGATGQRGPITQRLQEAYATLPERPGWATDLPPFESSIAEE